MGHMTGKWQQVDLLSPPEPPQPRLGQHDTGELDDELRGIEARFQALWLAGERTGCRATEAQAWVIAEQIGARTGEDRLCVLDRLIPDGADILPAPGRARELRSKECGGTL